MNGTVTNYTDEGSMVVIPAIDETTADTAIYSTVYNADTPEWKGLY